MSIAIRNKAGELEMIWVSSVDGLLRMLWFDRHLWKTRVDSFLLTGEQHIGGCRG